MGSSADKHQLSDAMREDGVFPFNFRDNVDVCGAKISICTCLL